MAPADLHLLIDDLTGSFDALGRDRIEGVLQSSARLRRWLDGVDVRATRRLSVLAETEPVDVEEAVAKASRSSNRRAERKVKRSRTADAFPGVADALDAGDASGEHLDVLDAATRHLTPDQRDRLADHDAELAGAAAETTPEAFARLVRSTVDAITADDGLERFRRQRRNTLLRSWTDKTSGMICIRGEFDPERGRILLGRLATIEDRWHRTGTGDDDPDQPNDPLARHHYRMAMALLEATRTRPNTSTGAGERPIGEHGTGNVEIMITIDHDTLLNGTHPGSVNTSGLPVESVRRLLCQATIIPVIIDTHGAVLNIGREQRLANRHQRRALAAMHPTCAAPSCDIPFERCHIHHIIHWQHGGHTNLNNMIPLCNQHHHKVHEHGWTLHLDPTTRTLTTTHPDGTIHHTHPNTRPHHQPGHQPATGPPARAPAS